MNKELEKIKKLYKSYCEKVGLNETDILGFDLSFAFIEKELKALEIIKEKVKIEFNDHYFGFANNYYIIVNNGVLNPIKVTEEEYNLLKEVLL